MSLIELANRHKLKNMAKLFMKERMPGFTLDNIVYGKFNITSLSYDKSYFTANETLTNVKYSVSYESMKRYFKWRESYMNVRREFLKINPNTISKDKIYEFYSLGINRSDEIVEKILKIVNYKKGNEC